jgi:hypothetical protein
VDVTVVVSTFGGPSWMRLARERAIPSAEALGVPVIHTHARTLHEARNGSLAKVGTPWVIHLDADDELEQGYVEAMATGSADVRAPSVRYVRGAAADWPKMPRVAGHGHECVGACLPQGNWLVVGAAVRTELMRRIGGWRDYPVYEDWSTWLRCHLAGATFEAIPQAIYRAHVRRGSRNRSGSRDLKMSTHRRIERDCGLAPGGTPL